ncbi:C40 family peptidase [uncultured Peptoniphilus sp.]|uniref:C40 family peptidase n=1 Tax=uncultured Peptoniphilus sp. TaxID=254354 RepID=UPI00280605FB|nr:C40 family peptidase [uncultured Peptoniphilus sp.]
MWSIKNKLPMGLIALCAVSIVSLKDTGIFINEHIQKTYSGNQVSFAIGEEVNVIEKTKDSYIVKKGKAKLTIPQSKILLTEVNVPTYKVIKQGPIKKDGAVLRNLFIGEYAVEVQNNKDSVVIRCNDGTVGTVSKDSIEKIASTRENETKVKVKANTKVKNDKEVLDLKAGESVNVVDFNNGDFIIKDDNGKKYNLPAEKLAIETGKKVEKTEEKDSEENSLSLIKVMDEDSKEIEKIAKSKAKIKAEKEMTYAPQDLSNASETVNRIISSAYSKMGTTYVYGATGDGGYDCSGFVYAIYKNEMGISIPRSSSEQANAGRPIEKLELREGDLVFFNTSGSGVSHVGIYIGGGEFIHASSGAGKVVISSLSEDYYAERYLSAARVL